MKGNAKVIRAQAKGSNGEGKRTLAMMPSRAPKNADEARAQIKAAVQENRLILDALAKL